MHGVGLHVVPWRSIDVSDDGRTMTVHFRLSSVHHELDHVSVAERASEVVITGWVRLRIADDQQLAPQVLALDADVSEYVELERSLGDRVLVDGAHPPTAAELRDRPPDQREGWSEEDRDRLQKAAELVAADLHRTTGRSLWFRADPGEVPEGSAQTRWWSCSAGFSSESSYASHLVLVTDDEAELTAELADWLCEHIIHDELHMGWPECPTHGRHPLWAGVHDGRAVWACQNDDTTAIPIGELR